MPKAQTETKRHRWMEMSYVPVEVVGTRGDGEPATFPLADTPLIGVSCFDCHIPLTSQNAEEECPGEPEE